MIVTANKEWAEKARYLTTQAKDDRIEFIHNEIGYNYRLTNVLAALGVAQLEQVDDYIAAKRRIADAYDAAFRDVPGLTLMPDAPWASSVNGCIPCWWMRWCMAWTAVLAEKLREARIEPARCGSRLIKVRPIRMRLPCPARWPNAEA